MDGSSLIFIVMPIVIPLVLFTGVGLVYIADSRSGRRRPGTGAIRWNNPGTQRL